MAALKAAVGWYGHAVADTLLLDPGGVVSNVGGANWNPHKDLPRFPDMVLEIDGKRLPSTPATARAASWDRTIERAFAEGREHVDVVVQSAGERRSLRLTVGPLSPLAWWIYAGSLLFAGALYILAGLVALWAGPRSALARTFGKVGIFSGLLIVLTFDFHTTRTLVPLFFLANAMVPVTWVQLALRLPDDAPFLARAPWLERVLDSVGACVALGFVTLYFSGEETRWLQQIWTPFLAASFLFFGIAFLVRFFRARGVNRSRMRALLAAVIPPHMVIIALTVPGERGAIVEALSFGTLSLFPFAIAYAFIRHDLWGSRALLSRILTRLLVGAVACAFAVGVGTAVAVELGVPFAPAVLAVGFGGIAAAALVLFALRVVDRRVFSARLQYKPTVAQLSEQLIAITSPVEVAGAVERTIRKWLPCDHVELTLSNRSAADANGLQLLVGQSTPSPAMDGHLMLPVEFGDLMLGTLRVGEKAGHALFTDEDLDLLHTIVNQGALALAHAYAYQELEVRRREQAAAWRGERAALVETVAAEIAHEIRYPINFFRSVFESGAGGKQLDADDMEIGREEVERLERLVSGLRRMVNSRIERRRVRVVELCQRVETLLRDSFGSRRLERSVPDRVEISCDLDQVTQILVNLVSNALQAAPDGSVGVAWSQCPNSAELVVWDTGPGFEEEVSKLFAPWYTTKAKGTGLGLAITHRLVRAHGWNITATRRDNRTLFVVTIPMGDVLVTSDSPGPKRASAEVA